MDVDPSIWDAWAAARPPSTVIHLDSAAAGRSSRRTLDATTAHAQREATEGAYVAAARMTSRLQRLREILAGLLGVDSEGLAFTESAESALDHALRAWPRTESSTVAVAPGEWGPNLHAFTTAGLRVVPLRTDGQGVVDVEALAELLRAKPPTLVHLTQQASHRALRQPVADVATVCREAHVPLWVDAAQALGQCATNTGGDVVYGTSRKWLTGPRGVGMLAISDRWRPSLRISVKPGFEDAPLLANVESFEAHVAGRIGLANAVDEYTAAGPELVAARLDEVGRMVRSRLADLPNWHVVDPADALGAISAVRPAAGQDVFAVREQLLHHHAILTTACATARAPLEMTEPWLRISPHVDVTADQIDELRAALATL